MSYRYYVRLPLLAIAFVWLLTRNLWRLGKQAWDWTVCDVRSHHRAMKRNFKSKGTP